MSEKLTGAMEALLPDEFKSGNNVPVERATFTRSRMIEVLQAAIAQDRQQRGETLQQEVIAVIESVASKDTDWDNSYWNQAVSRCVSAAREVFAQHQGAQLTEPEKEITIDPTELIITTYYPEVGGSWSRASPRGVRIVHIPTGADVSCHESPSPFANREAALEKIKVAVKERLQSKFSAVKSDGGMDPLPCPFCGSDNVIHNPGDKSIKCEDSVMCLECDARMYATHEPGSALVQWNRRQPASEGKL